MRISDWSSDVCSSDLVGIYYPSIAQEAGLVGDVPVTTHPNRRVQYTSSAACLRAGDRSYRGRGAHTFRCTKGTDVVCWHCFHRVCIFLTPGLMRTAEADGY